MDIELEFNWLIDWLNNSNSVILYLEVRESHLLYINIYIFYVVVSSEVF